MKIATLEYIHRLLEDDVTAHKLRCQEARDKAEEYKSRVGRDRQTLKELNDNVEGIYGIYIRALNALNDFEDEDF